VESGVCIDGHEWDYVVEYWHTFLQQGMSWLKFMWWWDGVNMEIAIDPPEYNLETEIVWVSHDESISYSNDNGGKGWGSDDHPYIHKEGNR
jgi:hypothetical protein